MQSRPLRTGRARAASTATALLAVGALVAGCSSPASNDSPGTAEDLDVALEKGGSLTYWSWAPQSEAQAAAFEKEYPNVDVKVVNVGTNTDQYTALQNAIQAGSGGPDVAQVEYYAIPQFALSDSLVNLEDFGFGEYEELYTSGTWDAVSFGDGIWGLPQDSGPMAMLYNKTLFDAHGIAVPTTWEEYIEAARTLHAADPEAYILADNGDAGFATSMIWQAGGKPFQVDGTTVSIDLQDEGSQKWASTWNELVQNDLLAPISPWSDEWYQGIGSDKLGTLLMGAWMPGILETSVPDGAGDWRVAPMPTYDGTPVTAENGGGGQVVLKDSENPALAAAFVRWINSDPAGVSVFLEAGGFPSTVADLESEEFLNAAPEYFGGQKINEVLVQASREVPEGWEYLPYQAYAISIFGDTVGQAYEQGTDLNEGLVSWQEQLVEYGDQQGFTIE